MSYLLALGVTLCPVLLVHDHPQQLCPALLKMLLCSDGTRDVCQVDSQ